MSLERQQLYIDLVTNQLTILKYFKTIVDKFDSPKLENTHLPITVLLKNARRKTNREERHINSTNIFWSLHINIFCKSWKYDAEG